MKSQCETSPRVDGGRRWVQLAHDFYRRTKQIIIRLRFNVFAVCLFFFFNFIARRAYVFIDFFILVLITRHQLYGLPSVVHRQWQQRLHAVDRHRSSTSSVWRRCAGWVVSFLLILRNRFSVESVPRHTDWFKTKAMNETVAMDCALQFLCKFSPL